MLQSAPWLVCTGGANTLSSRRVFFEFPASKVTRSTTSHDEAKGSGFWARNGRSKTALKKRNLKTEN